MKGETQRLFYDHGEWTRYKPLIPVFTQTAVHRGEHAERHLHRDEWHPLAGSLINNKTNKRLAELNNRDERR